MARLSEELRQVEREFFKTVSTLVVSAFALVAGLAWNTAITKIMERYFAVKPSSSIWLWLVYAFIVTLIAVVITLYVGRMTREKEQEAELEKKS